MPNGIFVCRGVIDDTIILRMTSLYYLNPKITPILCLFIIKPSNDINNYFH